MRALLLATLLAALALLAAAPAASAHKMGCKDSGPGPFGGVVGQVYDFAMDASEDACGLTVGVTDSTCHFLVGDACPV